MKSKSTLIAASLAISAGLTVVACDVEEGRDQDEADRLAPPALGAIGKGLLGQVGKALAGPVFEELLPSKELIVSLSEETLHEIAEFTNDAVISNWHHEQKIDLETMADELELYFRPECSGVGTSNDCSESNLTSKFEAAKELAKDGRDLWNAYDSDAPNYEANRLIFGQNLQLAASMNLLMLSEVTTLNGEDYRDLTQEYPENQRDLCTFAGEYYVTMQDLEHRVRDRVEPLYTAVALTKGPGSTLGHKFMHGCFDGPDGQQCGQLVREIKSWWGNGKWNVEGSGASAAAVKAEGEALRDEAVAEAFGEEKKTLLGLDFDDNRLEFARIASCVDVPGPIDDFCSIFDGNEVHIRTAHGTHVSVGGLEASDPVVQDEQIRATETFEAECSGGKVMFTDGNGSYLTESNGDITWEPTKTANSKFSPLPQVDGTWGFGTSVGTYIRARANGKVETQTVVLGSERFHVILASGRVAESHNFCADYDKKTIALETTHGRYLRAGHNRVVNQQTSIGPWEEFYVYCEADNKAIFWTDHNRRIRARDTGEVDQADKVGPWEKFTPVHVEGDTWAFETAHGRYLRAEGAEGSWDINNNALDVKDAEAFRIILRD